MEVNVNHEIREYKESMFFGESGTSCKLVSTKTDAKYLPEGVIEIVTVFTIPLNFR